MSTKNSITNWYKNRRDVIAPILIISLFSAVFFGFGYLSAKEFNPAPIVIEKCGEDVSMILSNGL